MVVLKKLFAGKLCFGSLKVHIINLKFVQKYLKKATTYQRKTKAARFETVPSDL
jgi:hypothetical protein